MGLVANPDPRAQFLVCPRELNPKAWCLAACPLHAAKHSLSVGQSPDLLWGNSLQADHGTGEVSLNQELRSFLTEAAPLRIQTIVNLHATDDVDVWRGLVGLKA